VALTHAEKMGFAKYRREYAKAQERASVVAARPGAKPVEPVSSWKQVGVSSLGTPIWEKRLPSGAGIERVERIAAETRPGEATKGIVSEGPSGIGRLPSPVQKAVVSLGPAEKLVTKGGIVVERAGEGMARVSWPTPAGLVGRVPAPGVREEPTVAKRAIEFVTPKKIAGGVIPPEQIPFVSKVTVPSPTGIVREPAPEYTKVQKWFDIKLGKISGWAETMVVRREEAEEAGYGPLAGQVQFPKWAAGLGFAVADFPRPVIHP